MTSSLGRALLAVAAFVLIASALLHGSVFVKVSAAIETSALAPLLGKSYRALWLADSCTTAVIGIICAVLAWRPALAAPSIVLLLALIPAATAALIFHFIGAFPPGYFMSAAAALMVAAALSPRKRSAQLSRG